MMITEIAVSEKMAGKVNANGREVFGRMLKRVPNRKKEPKEIDRDEKYYSPWSVYLIIRYCPTLDRIMLQ